METGQVIVFNKSISVGFIKNDVDKLYYIFRPSDCKGEIAVDDEVTFHVRGVREAYDIKLKFPINTDADNR